MEKHGILRRKRTRIRLKTAILEFKKFWLVSKIKKGLQRVLPFKKVNFLNKNPLQDG